jgi:hypothetical protein
MFFGDDIAVPSPPRSEHKLFATMASKLRPVVAATAASDSESSCSGEELGVPEILELPDWAPGIPNLLNEGSPATLAPCYFCFAAPTIQHVNHNAQPLPLPSPG